MITNYTIYKFFHTHCPFCNDTHIVQTISGWSNDPEVGIIDNNKAECQSCKWEGVVHDLLPKDKDHGPLKEDHICKHNIRYPHECVWCEQQINGIIQGSIPV